METVDLGPVRCDGPLSIDRYGIAATILRPRADVVTEVRVMLFEER